MSESYYLRFTSHDQRLSQSLVSLLSENYATDVMLSPVTFGSASKPQKICAHKIILSSFSPYFKSLFENVTSQQLPIVIINGVSHEILKTIVDFCYRGEIVIQKDRLNDLVSAAQMLQIEGAKDFVIPPIDDTDDDYALNDGTARGAARDTDKSIDSNTNVESEKCSNDEQCNDNDEKYPYDNDNDNDSIQYSHSNSEMFREFEDKHESRNNAKSRIVSLSEPLVPNLKTLQMYSSTARAIAVSTLASVTDTADRSESRKIMTHKQKEPIKDTAAVRTPKFESHSSNESSSSAKRSRRGRPPLSAPTKNVTFPSASDGKKQRTHNKCPHCPQVYYGSQAMQDHITSVHLNSGARYVCPICKKEYTWRITLRKHLKVFHHMTNPNLELTQCTNDDANYLQPHVDDDDDD